MAWKPLCKLGDIEPGEMKVIAADGTDFLVLRGTEDELLVVPAKCPHMDTPLCNGFFDGSLLTCSQHLWQWSVKDGSMQGIAEEPLAVYPSKAQGDTVCIDFERELRYHHEAEG
jgi:toluene monooxygenase system ferredoxin subunit